MAKKLIIEKSSWTIPDNHAPTIWFEVEWHGTVYKCSGINNCLNHLSLISRDPATNKPKLIKVPHKEVQSVTIKTQL